jgi:hypothetical protein
MIANSLSDQIDLLSRRLAYRCHRYVYEGFATRNQIARAAGLSWTLIKDIAGPSFAPTFKTLKALDAVIPIDWEPTVGFGEIYRETELDLKLFKLGARRISGERSEHAKIYMEPNALSRVEPDQMARAQSFLEQRRGSDRVVRADPVDLDIIKTLAPQCASHYFDIDDPNPENFKVIRWDGSTGFNGGFDYTGTYLALFRDDDAMFSCAAEDFLTVRETRWPHFSAIKRQLRERGNREYLRLLVPVRGSDNREKMISITRPRSFAA